MLEPRTSPLLLLQQLYFLFAFESKKVCMFEEFLTLSQTKLIDLVRDDSLEVPNEDVVYNACIKWLHHAIEERSQTFHKVKDVDA